MSHNELGWDETSSLPFPECEGGFTERQVTEIMGDRIEEFWRWMSGQTMMLCEGRSYNHERREYEESCGGVAHGPITYSWDLKRFLGIVPGKEIFD